MVMITGDYPPTARSIARAVHLIPNDQHPPLLGQDIERLRRLEGWETEALIRVLRASRRGRRAWTAESHPDPDAAWRSVLEGIRDRIIAIRALRLTLALCMRGSL